MPRTLNDQGRAWIDKQSELVASAALVSNIDEMHRILASINRAYGNDGMYYLCRTFAETIVHLDLAHFDQPPKQALAEIRERLGAQGYPEMVWAAVFVETLLAEDDAANRAMFYDENPYDTADGLMSMLALYVVLHTEAHGHV